MARLPLVGLIRSVFLYLLPLTHFVFMFIFVFKIIRSLGTALGCIVLNLNSSCSLPVMMHS